MRRPDDHKKRALRKRALVEYKKREKTARCFNAPLQPNQLIKELQIHQIELELQNEELITTQVALETTRDRYRDLYDYSPIGYVTLEKRGVITESNLCLANMLSTSTSEMVGRSFSDFVASEDQDDYFLVSRNTWMEKRRNEIILRLQRPDESVFWAKCEWLYHEYGAGCLRIAISDITIFKKLQAQLAMADRLASVGLLAAGLAHEINNPLTAVMCCLEMMNEDLTIFVDKLSIDDELIELLRRASIDLVEMNNSAKLAFEGTKRIRDIVANLRIFSHVDKNKMEPLCLNALLSSLVQVTKKEISCRGQLLEQYGELPQFAGNRGQMCQIFLNLIVNSVQSLDESAKETNRVTIRTWQKDGTIFTEIGDTGCGIPVTVKAKIFDPFFTTKGAGQGTGLGLAICSKILAEIGGTIAVESTFGKGTRVTVGLPINEISSEADLTNTTTVGGPVRNKRGRILVIDDDGDVCRTMAKMLRHHDVVTAYSGEEGRNILSNDDNFDVIFCDLMMPKVTGFDLAQWMKKERSGLCSRVVFMSGGVFTPADQKRVDELQMPLLKKPMNKKELNARLDQIMNK